MTRSILLTVVMQWRTRYKQLGRHEEAERRLRDTIHMNPHHVDARYNYGNLLRTVKEREDEALHQYDAVIPFVGGGFGGNAANYPVLVQVLNNKGATLLAMDGGGREEEAVATWQRAAKAAPFRPDL